MGREASCWGIRARYFATTVPYSDMFSHLLTVQNVLRNHYGVLYTRVVQILVLGPYAAPNVSATFKIQHIKPNSIVLSASVEPLFVSLVLQPP